jgi:hypothetical protein
MTFCVGHQLTDSEQHKKNTNNQNHLNVNAMDATKERDLNGKVMSGDHGKCSYLYIPKERCGINLYFQFKIF